MTARQPVHTVYGGAHLFRPNIAAKVGAVAKASLDRYAPSAATLAQAVGLPANELAERVYARVREKLEREPVEDYRIDFEDGYGDRPDDEEDRDATAAANAVLTGARERTLPTSIGFRIKALVDGIEDRAIRTLDLVLTTLAEHGGLPAGFVVTLPKVTRPQQVATLAARLAGFEEVHRLAPRTIGIEIMVEDPAALYLPHGRVALPEMVRRADGRLRSAHFGAYDYLSACGVAASEQRLRHPMCDFARSLMQASLARTGVRVVDGATAVLPLPALGDVDDVASVHRGWRHHYEDVRHGLASGFYQGWDVHPAQLVSRYTAIYTFFLEAAEPAGARLRNYVESRARATRLGGAFDDAATAAGLVGLFLRGHACGAFDDADVLRLTSLTVDDLRSALATLDARR
jgi:citrate lyase beta subunit